MQTIAPEAPAYKPIPVSRRVGEMIRPVADNIRQRVVSSLETLGRSARLFAEILYFVVSDSVALRLPLPKSPSRCGNCSRSPLFPRFSWQCRSEPKYRWRSAA